MYHDTHEIEQGVRFGEMQILEFNGTLLTVVEKQDGEFVICCAIGKGLIPVMPVLYKMAKKAGCSSIRFHTAKKSLARLSGAYKPVAVGRDKYGLIIYRVEVV